ncbi:phosphatidate cytidylyltransferase [Erysipelotrichaceae bacterium OH741_COT-311]|nr:phosphatidate cytidylyltransferase [Erysipelotrichaceae bacterium OH741_COT-311]
MKQRIMVALLLILLVFPPLYFGGFLLHLLVAAFILIGCYEFISLRKNNFQILLYVIMLIAFCCLYFFKVQYQILTLISFILVLFLLALFDETVGYEDVTGVFTMTMLFYFAVASIYKIYSYGGLLMIYVAIANYATDSGAYFAGSFFGKHKLIERISPKKTVEGFIGGWIFSFMISFAYACFVIPHFFSLHFYLITSFLIPLVAQVGDLAFSLMKRHYGKKDFGTIFLSHGGALDRIDSLLFTLVFFFGILTVIA